MVKSKLPKLTANVPKEANRGQKLTSSSRLERPFRFAFHFPLQDGYRFADLQIRDLKNLQNFFDIASGLTINQMDSTYRRDADKADVYNNQQVQHYGTKNGFRIHGIYNEDGYFVVIRIDPNHKKHNI